MTFSTELLETLSHLIEGGGSDYSALRLQLDLEGFDAENPELVADAVKQARQVMRDRRFLRGAMGQFTSVMLTNAEIGQRLGGIPKSSVQAIACGRIPERFTAAQRDLFKVLIADVVAGCRSALEALG